MTDDRSTEIAAKIAAEIGEEDLADTIAALAEVTDPFASVLEAVDGLDEERQYLLLFGALGQVSKLLNHAHETGKDAQSAFALGANVLHFSDYVMKAIHAKHEDDWTRTGDITVDRVWNQFTDLLETLRFRLEDLPEDVAERIAEGEGTEEDYAMIVKTVAGRSGQKPETLRPQRTQNGPMKGPKPPPPDVNGIGNYL